MANNNRTFPRGLGKSEIESARKDAEFRRKLSSTEAALPELTFPDMDTVDAFINAYDPDTKVQDGVSALEWLHGDGVTTGRTSGGKAYVPARRGKSMFNEHAARTVQVQEQPKIWDERIPRHLISMNYDDFLDSLFTSDDLEGKLPDVMTADDWRMITLAQLYKKAVRFHDYPYACGHLDDWLAIKAWIAYMDDIQVNRWHDESAPAVDYGYVRGMLLVQHTGWYCHSYTRLSILRYIDFNKGITGATTWKR